MVIDNSDIPVEILRLDTQQPLFLMMKTQGWTYYTTVELLNSNVTGCIVTENELHFNVHIHIKFKYVQLV